MEDAFLTRCKELAVELARCEAMHGNEHEYLSEHTFVLIHSLKQSLEHVLRYVELKHPDRGFNAQSSENKQRGNLRDSERTVGTQCAVADTPIIDRRLFMASPSLWNVSSAPLLSNSYIHKLEQKGLDKPCLFFLMVVGFGGAIVHTSGIAKYHAPLWSSVGCFAMFFFILFHRANKTLFYHSLTRFDTILLSMSSIFTALSFNLAVILDGSFWQDTPLIHIVPLFLAEFLLVTCPAAIALGCIDCFKLGRRSLSCIVSIILASFLFFYVHERCVRFGSSACGFRNHEGRLDFYRISYNLRGHQIVFLAKALLSQLSGVSFCFIRPIFVEVSTEELHTDNVEHIRVMSASTDPLRSATRVEEVIAAHPAREPHTDNLKQLRRKCDPTESLRSVTRVEEVVTTYPAMGHGSLATDAAI